MKARVPGWMGALAFLDPVLIYLVFVDVAVL